MIYKCPKCNNRKLKEIEDLEEEDFFYWCSKCDYSSEYSKRMKVEVVYSNYTDKSAPKVATTKEEVIWLYEHGEDVVIISRKLEGIEYDYLSEIVNILTAQ